MRRRADQLISQIDMSLQMNAEQDASFLGPSSCNFACHSSQPMVPPSISPPETAVNVPPCVSRSFEPLSTVMPSMLPERATM
jgi:hypothetical protein